MIMRSTRIFVTSFVFTAGLCGGVVADIPSHPDDLEFPPLDFTVPEASDYRQVLPCGVPVYLAPSGEFPLVTVSFSFKGGSYLEGPDETGLGDTLGSQMRRGGTMEVTAEEVDERFDFLAANVSTYVGSEQSGASINSLRSNFDEAFGLFMDVVRNPGFDEGRLRVYKDAVIEELKQRNDAPMRVAMTRLGMLTFGEDHYAGRQPTQGSIKAVSPDSLGALHERIFHPGNLTISVTGDFDPGGMMEALELALEDWEKGEPAGDPPPPVKVMVPGVYHADVGQEDLPQGLVLILCRSITRDDPDAMAMQVMNHILGGGGFTSRITNRVRSDEGLAYNASSFLQPNVHFPGVFGAFAMTKNSTVALATKLMLEEIDRIGDELVSEEELELARNSFIEKFPQRFTSKDAMLGVFVADEMTGRPADYWRQYRDEVRAVSIDDVMDVANRRLSSDAMVILVVGDWSRIEGGDMDGRASMAEFFSGEVTHLPMLDPLTLEPID